MNTDNLKKLRDFCAALVSEPDFLEVAEQLETEHDFECGIFCEEKLEN